jgi:two-component system, chemotaxis family, chemotaxis protein CheY
MKILVVDDELDMKTLFEQRFRKEIRIGSIQLVFALSAQEAISYLNANMHEAVLILSDINMPGMSGMELLAYIKQEYSKPPPIVMMITAYGDQENHDKAMNLGADDFLTKPIDFEILKYKLNSR